MNFGYNDCEDRDVPSKSLNLQVFTSKAGGLCVCCSLPSDIPGEISYSIYFLHKGKIDLLIYSYFILENDVLLKE